MRRIIVHIVAAGLLAGCASQSAEPSHILAREFKSQYRLGHMQTMKDAEYLGQKDGRAYLRIKSMSLTGSKKWTEQLVYVELSELDKTFREQLPAKEYKQP